MHQFITLRQKAVLLGFLAGSMSLLLAMQGCGTGSQEAIPNALIMEMRRREVVCQEQARAAATALRSCQMVVQQLSKEQARECVALNPPE